MKLSLSWAALLAAASGCVATAGTSGSPMGSGPVYPAQPAPTGASSSFCDEELGADASDDFGAAPAITIPTGDRTIAGCLVPKDNGDVFAIQIPASNAGSLLRIDALAPADSAARVELYDGDRRSRVSETATEGDGAHVWIAAAERSMVYVKVKSPHASKFRPYQLRIQASPLPDADEPNDSRERPIALALGAPRQALVYTLANVKDRDVDVYRVDVPRPGRLHVVVDDVPADSGVRAELFNADFRKLRSSNSVNAGATVRIDSDPVAAGSYQVHVSRGGDWPIAGRGEPPYRYSRPYRVTVTVD